MEFQPKGIPLEELIAKTSSQLEKLANRKPADRKESRIKRVEQNSQAMMFMLECLQLEDQ